MKKKKSKDTQKPSKRFVGADIYPFEELEIDPSVVSATEMTGLIPAVREDEFNENDFEEYYM